MTPAVPLSSLYLGLTFDISVSGKSSFPALSGFMDLRCVIVYTRLYLPCKLKGMALSDESLRHICL